MNDSGMTRPVGIMPNHLDLREITFTNLLLLDFNPAEMESKYRVVFNRDMFALPNKKAMEVIMHFLFTKLHPQLAYEEFRDCWPVRDKVLEQQFRKVCFNWVSRIQKEDPEARLPRIVQSLFHSPGGDRFCGFLHHFSLYILTKVMYRDHGKIISIPTFPIKTVHNHSFTHVMSRALEAHYIVLKKRFLEFTQHAVQVEHHWKEYAMETTKEFRSLVKKKRDLQRQVMEMDGMIAPQGSSIGVRTDYQEEVEVLKRTQQLQKVRDLWAGIEEFYTVQAPQRKIVDSVLQGEANKYHIDAADIQPKVPDMLLRDCEREIKKRNVEDTYVGGKVNLFSIIQLWNLSLSKIKEQLNQEPLPSFDDQCPAVRSALHTHHAHLTNTTALREAIEGTMPAMKGSIKEMKLQCYKSLEQQHSRPAQAPVLFKLGLVPPTPPVSFAAADTPAAERITSFHSTLKMSPDTVLTPDVIQAWTKTVRRLDDKQESVTKLAKNKKAGPSRLPRPKQHVQPGTQTGNTKPLTSKSTQKKKKKPTQGHAEKSFSYPHYVTPRSQEPKKESKESPLILKPQTILANQIADAVAMDETTSSSLSSTATSSRTSTPKAQALVDPAGALGRDAFQPRDLIPRTPAKKESDETCTEPRSEYKLGLLLETILDESPGSAIPSPAEEKHSTDPSAQAVLSWTDINFTPKLLKTSSFQESPPEHDPLSTSLGTGLGFTDVKRTPDVAGDEEFKEPVSFNLSNIEPTPKSVKKSLFEDSPQPQEMLPSKQHAPLSHPFTRQTPESVRLPLVIESSPQLDFWLLPQNKNGNHPGSQATPNAIRTELFDGSTLENGNPSFDDLRFLSISGEQFTSQADKASATQPTPMRSPLSRHTTPKITAFSSDHKLDTTELAERLNRIKQAPLERDSWGLQHNTSLKPSTTKHTPKSADKAVNLQTQNVYATHQKALDSSGAHPSSTFSQPTQQTLQHSIHSEQRETVFTPSGAHPSPKPGTVFKENVSSSSYEVDTSALIQRLNKIKQTQQSFSAPHFIESISFEARAADSVPRKENDAETASDTSLLASRLDQIKQAQKSQQVTPGASTGEDLSTSRTSEPALLTPLTPSSRGTPSEDGNKNEMANFSFHSPQHVTSLPDSPSSPLDRNFVLQSPFKSNQLVNSLLQQTPSPLSAGSELNSGGLGLFEDLHWETATPSLPQRLVTRAGLASEGNSSFVPATSNSLHSSAPCSISTPLLENSVHRPDCMTWVPGSSQTPASVVGFIEEEEQDASPRLDLASPHSYRGNVPSHVTSPVIGKLIDLE